MFSVLPPALGARSPTPQFPQGPELPCSTGRFPLSPFLNHRLLAALQLPALSCPLLVFNSHSSMSSPLSAKWA